MCTRLPIGLTLLVCLAGCAGAGPSAPEPLLIVSDATFPPFHYVDETGVPTGFDIELARLMAERAGLRPTIAVLPYDQLHAGLSRGLHDLVAATTGVTPEREQEYLFTDPYFETCQAALVRVGDDEPTSKAGLEGRRVGASGTGTAARAMRSIAGSAPVSLEQEGVSPLEDGVVDAIIVDEFDAVDMARASDGRLRVLSEPIATEQYAFVLDLGREDLKRRLDDALASLRADGSVAALRARFGVERDAEWPVVITRNGGGR